MTNLVLDFDAQRSLQRVEDIAVVIGEVVKLGQLELTLKEEEQPIINTITVDVVYTDAPLIGDKKVTVTTFPVGDKITPDNVLETKSETILYGDTSIAVILDNGGAGCPDGTYTGSRLISLLRMTTLLRLGWVMI